MKSFFPKSDEIYSLYAFAFFIPLNPKWFGLGLIIIFLETLWKFRRINRVPKVNPFNPKNPIFWLLSFYIFHFIGLIFTSNFAFAWMDIGMKSTFALFPLYFLIIRPEINPIKLFSFFLWGAVFSVLFYFAFSFANYWETGNLNKGVFFSFWMHRGYYTTYLVLGCTFVLTEIVRKNRLDAKQSIALFVLLIGVYFAEAKTGVSALALVGLVLLIHNLKKRLSWLKFSLTLGGVLLISSLLLTKLFTGNNRFSGALDNIKNRELDITSVESTTARILMWETSLELIREKPILGVGTGDIKDELQKRNYSKGYSGVADKNLNCHNQFFNSWLSLGVLGLIALLGIFITLFIPKIEATGFFIQSAAFILFVTFLTESFLEVQAGIIPFAFLVSIIGIIGNKEKPIR